MTPREVVRTDMPTPGRPREDPASAAGEQPGDGFVTRGWLRPARNDAAAGRERASPKGPSLELFSWRVIAAASADYFAPVQAFIAAFSASHAVWSLAVGAPRTHRKSMPALQS